jgi:DNA modification methylase
VKNKRRYAPVKDKLQTAQGGVKYLVTQRRRYGIINVAQAREIALDWIAQMNLMNVIKFGLPEVDDRYHIWRVPLKSTSSEDNIGEVVIDARTSLILEEKSTRQEILEARLLGRQNNYHDRATARGKEYVVSALRNTVVCGDSELALQDFPANSIDLVFTSPPYFNARPEYTDYLTYDDYLGKMRRVIKNIHRVLGEGRFFLINVSPILLRRANRTESSKRLAVPFDFHRIFIEEGYDFIDDIIWMKPEGAGWATGRGRRFAADRNPLQYKPVPVTEYVLVYRKHSERLIDWHIRNHPNQQLVKSARISDGYERTNVWKIKPAHDKRHPAIFPLELAEKVISYYSFKNDVVLDPFAGIGTVGAAAIKLGRRFVLIEQERKYVEIISKESASWLGKSSKEVLFVNCNPPDTASFLF